MNRDIQPQAQSANSPSDAGETLRLLASLPPPLGLTDRVHRRLKIEQMAPGRSWLQALTVRRLQFASATVAVVALAGGSWNLHRINHLQPLVAPPHQSAPGAFGGAEVKRVPPTLAPIHVPPAPKKKLGLGKNLPHGPGKPAAKSGPLQPQAEPEKTQP